MEATEFDTDALLKLLSDALRRGPGSPEWHDAVARFSDANGPGADEYRLLLRARERLESGKEYRQVRAGAAFTRSVFEQLDKPARPGDGAPKPAVLIGLLCLIVVMAAGGALLTHLLSAKSNDAEKAELAAQLFSVPKHQWNFSNGVPTDLTTAGTLKLGTRDDGVGIVPQSTSLPANGMLSANDPMDLAHGVCLEAQVLYQPGDTSLALIVSDQPAPQTATFRSGTQFGVILDSTGAHCYSGAGIATLSHPLNAGPHTIRLKFLKSVGSVEVDGHLIWSGGSPLGATGYPVLNWMKSTKAQNPASVRSLSVLLP